VQTRSYPRFHLSSRYYTRNSSRCLHVEDFSLYLHQPDPFRTRVAKVVTEYTVASVKLRYSAACRHHECLFMILVRKLGVRLTSRSNYYRDKILILTKFRCVKRHMRAYKQWPRFLNHVIFMHKSYSWKMNLWLTGRVSLSWRGVRLFIAWSRQRTGEPSVFEARDTQFLWDGMEDSVWERRIPRCHTLQPRSQCAVKN